MGQNVGDVEEKRCIWNSFFSLHFGFLSAFKYFTNKLTQTFFFFFWKWANAKWITANISFFGEGLPHPTPSQPRQRWLEQLLWTTAFQSIDTRLKDLRERKNWTLRICPAFVLTINEKDTGLLCSQQSPLNKQRLSDFWFFLRCWFFSHYEKCKEVTV